jgi:phosphoribosylaminoimidazole-succinocarboxamide synthase
MSCVAIQPDVPRGFRLFRRGKVRDTFLFPDNARLLMVASDRISAFDVILPTLIPDKGRLLTSLSAFWFSETAGLVPNHLLSTELPSGLDLSSENVEYLSGRSMVVRRAERIDVECVVRGYLAGSAWEEYRRSGTVAGVRMAPGLQQAGKLCAPIFTPAVKHDKGHDVTISPAQLASLVGADLAAQLEEKSRDLYELGSQFSLRRGIILADTKFEFGWVDGRLTLIDEMFTPDSSRFWDSATWATGSEPPSFDKQYVRNWLLSTDWNREPPAPELPPDVVEGTLNRYREACRRLTDNKAGEIP